MTTKQFKKAISKFQKSSDYIVWVSKCKHTIVKTDDNDNSNGYCSYCKRGMSYTCMRVVNTIRIRVIIIVNYHHELPFINSKTFEILLSHKNLYKLHIASYYNNEFRVFRHLCVKLFKHKKVTFVGGNNNYKFVVSHNSIKFIL